MSCVFCFLEVGKGNQHSLEMLPCSTLLIENVPRLLWALLRALLDQNIAFTSMHLEPFTQIHLLSSGQTYLVPRASGIGREVGLPLHSSLRASSPMYGLPTSFGQANFQAVWKNGLQKSESEVILCHSDGYVNLRNSWNLSLCLLIYKEVPML